MIAPLVDGEFGLMSFYLALSSSLLISFKSSVDIFAPHLAFLYSFI